MTDGPLHLLLRGSEEQSYLFVFHDGGKMLAEVASSSHVNADDTVVLLPMGASALEPAYNVRLADIRTVATPDGQVVYE